MTFYLKQIHQPLVFDDDMFSFLLVAFHSDAIHFLANPWNRGTIRPQGLSHGKIRGPKCQGQNGGVCS